MQTEAAIQLTQIHNQKIRPHKTIELIMQNLRFLDLKCML